MGNYYDALTCLKRLANITKVNEYLFYKALLNFSKDTDWKTDMNEYLEIAENKNWGEAAKYMLSDEFDESSESYFKLNSMNLSDGIKILIHQAYKSKTPDLLAPHFNYAELLTYNQLFEEAIKGFERIEISNLLKDQEDRENVSYYHAWALWKSGQKEKSIDKWITLIKSENFRYKSASAYFIGKYYYDLDELEKAKQYFEIVQEKVNESKYATLAWNYYNSLN